MVPRYLIGKIGGRPAGKRLEPKPKMVFPAEERQLSIVSAVGKFAKDVFGRPDHPMQFSNEEFRFWCVEMVDDKPNIAVCRACESTAYLKGSRDIHKEQGCPKSLVEAYKLLLRDSKCVICDSETTHQKWGVPLCKHGSCITDFMHEQPQPDALMFALQLVADSEAISGQSQ